MKELVLEVHQELRALKAEAETQKDHPRLIRVIDCLLRLTHIEGMEGSEDPGQPAQPPADPAADPAAPCEHKSTDIFGRCQQCGECQHVNVAPDGFCRTCDVEVAKPEPSV